MHHLIAIIKKLSSGKAKIGIKLAFFTLVELKILWMYLEKQKDTLLCLPNFRVLFLGNLLNQLVSYAGNAQIWANFILNLWPLWPWNFTSYLDLLHFCIGITIVNDNFPWKCDAMRVRWSKICDKQPDRQTVRRMVGRTDTGIHWADWSHRKRAPPDSS